MSVEIKNLNTNYINFPNTTSTFKQLINKYQIKNKGSERHNKKLLLKKIEAKIQELENNERENDFIISEVRRNAQLNQEILYSFGTKALNHIDEIQRLNVTTKIDKSKFFESDNLYQLTDFNNKKNKSLKTRYNDKIINLPKIYLKKRNANIFYDNKKKYVDFSLNKIYEGLTDKKNKIKNKKKIKNNQINFSVDSKENNKDILNYISPISKKDSPQNLTLFSEKSNFMNEKDENDLKINNEKKKNIVINNDYINYIQDIKNKFTKTEKKQERYFGRYKYGYDRFKLKYNYLQKKYFD